MRYARLCRKLNVDEDAQRRGWTLLQRIAVMQLDPAHSEQPTSASTSSKGDQTRIWRACVVFIVGVFQVKGPALRQQEINGSLKLSALLQQSKCTFLLFRIEYLNLVIKHTYYIMYFTTYTLFSVKNGIFQHII